MVAGSNVLTRPTVRPLAPGSGGWIRRLSPYALAHRRTVGIAMGGALVSMLATALTPQVMRELVDAIGRPGFPGLAVTALFLLGFCRFVFAYVRRMWGGRVALEIQFDLKTAIYEHLQKLDFASHDKLQTGQLVSRANADVALLERLLSFLPLMSANVLLFLTSLFFMLRMNVLMTLVALLILPGIGYFAQRMRKVAYPTSWDVQQRQAVIAGIVDESVSGVRVVKAFGQERRELDRLLDAAGDLYSARIRNVKVMSGYSAIMSMLPSIGQVAFFALGGWLTMQGRMTLGTFLAFQTYLVQLIAPVRMTTMMLAMAQMSRAGGERVLELLDTDAEVRDAPDAVELERRGGGVTFEGVTFGYLRSEPVLRDFDLTIAPGETVALVGGSGSGKSTLASLLPRFYDVQEGRVLVDGVDVRAVTLESLRGQIGVVFEDSFLFSDTVRYNIAYGRPDATDDEVIEAARASEAHEFIMRLPDGYDTVVGERGLTLSGGQRQRVALARALLTDPQVLLLDDATSSIDVRTEEEIHQTLRRLMAGRTAILIAHRRSTLSLADRIAVLEDGRVIDHGTHDELMARCETYHLLLAGPGEDAEGVGTSAAGSGVTARVTAAAWPSVESPTMGVPAAAPTAVGLLGMGPLRPEMAEALAKLPPATERPSIPLERETAAHGTFRLRDFIRPYRWALGAGLVLVALQAVIDLAGPSIMRYGIDHAISPAALASRLGEAGRAVPAAVSAEAASGLGRLRLIAAGFLTVTFLAVGLQRFVAIFTGRTAGRMLFALRARIFSQLQRLGLDYYDREMGGRVMTRMTSDVEALNNLLQDGLLNALVNGVTILGVLGIMSFMSLHLTLLLMTVFVPLVIVTALFRRASEKAYARVRDRVATVNASFQESVSGVRVTQAYTRERRNMADFRQVAGNHLEARIRSQRLQSAYFPFVDFLSVAATAVVFWGGVHLVRDGSLTPGALIAFVLYINIFFAPIQQLSQVFDSYQQARAAMNKIRELMETEVTTPVADAPVPVTAVRGQIDVSDVHFHYPTVEREALSGVDLHIPAGQTVALVGETGAGKSTLMKLVARFYDVTSGTVAIDGQDIRTLDLESYRRHLGYVPQESFLFSGDIRDNIAYGRPDATDGEVEDAARAVGAHEFIAHLAQGYRTPVTERGRSLSAGQRQLIALARARLVDPAILLLDEATANLDLATEARVQRAMGVVAEGRTTLLIAHRLQTAARADRIVVIDGGRIVEDGTHDELVAAGGRYAAMWEASDVEAVA